MAKQAKDLNDLFYEMLRDIYYAEKQIFRALPKMAKAAQAAELRQAFEKHRDQTEGQIDRLDQIFEMIGKAARGKTCEAIVGMIDEGKEVIEDFSGTAALDPGLIAGAQAIEHYEISRYGTLKAFAQELGLEQAAQLLDATLDEEKETDELLTKLSMSQINRKAA